MSKLTRPRSHYARVAAALLGQMIRKARIVRKMTAEDVAERVGLSRGLLRRIENGDLSCTLGSVFETAAVVGVPLFDSDEPKLTGNLAANTAVMALIPKAVKAPRATPDDDF